MRLSDLEQRTLEDLAKQLRQKFAAVEVRMYGSAARSQLGPESDIDLFVVVPQADWKTEQAIYDLCYDATTSCGRLISASIFTETEITQTPLRSAPLLKSIYAGSIGL